MGLRPHQVDGVASYDEAVRGGRRSHLIVIPTGGGKTYVFSHILQNHNGYALATAHRNELVIQMSLSLAQCGVYHRILGAPAIASIASQVHLEEVGKCYENPNAKVAVIGIKTLLSRADEYRSFLNKVSLYVTDEAHHVLKTNEWGRGTELTPNAFFLGVTATPCRSDGKGLGSHNDGIFDTLWNGPCGRDLINQGYLSPYRVVCPPNDLDLSDAKVSKRTGDFTENSIKKAVKRSHIMGDAVEHYLRFCRGMRGISFVVDIESGYELVEDYIAAGVPAAMLEAKTPALERNKIIREFKEGKILQLVNKDILGEGFDCPGAVCVSLLRPTESFGLYSQQVGRGLRTAEGKTIAYVIDHVGNFAKHGPPDRPFNWTLEPRSGKGGGGDGIPTKNCRNPFCLSPYEAFLDKCPQCGWSPPKRKPGEAPGPDYIEGDLVEMDPEEINKLIYEAGYVEKSFDHIVGECLAKRMPKVAIKKQVEMHAHNRESQKLLRASMAQWAGFCNHKGLSQNERDRLFLLKFKLNRLEAFALKKTEAEILQQKIEKEIENELLCLGG